MPELATRGDIFMLSISMMALGLLANCFLKEIACSLLEIIKILKKERN